ncbi:RNA polymerase sigma factor [Dyadobacter tibetensis]|uniref:RNA polymerase sigma factor n=1 Tax=Dyadobacter tibetensis TaxID=1211851 RepID=UPI000471F5F9|nr:sigma-70 family RNA polymerase sigma factor [Dyadobacter tibetensis]
MANQKLLDDLSGNLNHAFGDMYRDYFGMVYHFVSNNNGDRSDAEDLFQDTMLVLVEKLRNDQFELTASLKTYVMAIAKHLWLKRLRTAGHMVPLEDRMTQVLSDDLDRSIENEKTYMDRLQFYMTKITDHCNKLMHDMFFKSKSIEQIQVDYGYSTKHTAQNQKYKCMNQIKRIKEEAEKK